MPETGAEILARIKPRLDEDWTEICLRPDLIAEHDEAKERLAEAQVRVGPERLADGNTAESVELAEKVQALEVLIAESSVAFRFRGLSRDKFRVICDEHPPRPTNSYDLAVGYNTEALGDALVEASLIEPVFDDAAWAELVEVISIGEWNELRRCAEKVNGSVVTEAPKSALASRILSSRANGSEPQPPSE